MKELSKIQIAALVICLCSSLLSFVVMINQIKLASRTSDILAENISLKQREITEAQKSYTTVLSNLNSSETTEHTVEKEDFTEFGKRYVINKNSKKIHEPDCRYVKNVKEENREELVTDSIDELLKNGYDICSACEAQ